MRIFRPRALAAIDRKAAEGVSEQPVTTGTLIWRFIAEEERRYGPDGTERIYGTFGGDGDGAKEELCFGFLIENADLGVYRIWSRAWLVMK